MSVIDEMRRGKKILNSNNKINGMKKVGISSTKYTYLFSIHFQVCGSLIAILVMVVKKLYHFKFKFFRKRTSIIYFSAILCECYLIIVYDLKAKCTINNFRMFMFDSNHSLLYVPMHYKIKKSSQSSF